MVDSGNFQVVVFDLKGNRLSAWGERGKQSDQFRFGMPNGIAVDGCGLVYVSDHKNRRVAVYTPEGEPLQMLQSDHQPRLRPRDVAVDGSRVVFVGEGRVQVMERSGVTCQE